MGQLAAGARRLGIDLGSRTTKLVWLSGGEIESFEVFPTVHDPWRRLAEAVRGVPPEQVVGTGYGRGLLQERLGCAVVSEITACARGAGRLCPGARTVLDVGGQDAKALAVTPAGSVAAFEMNDRCAAGTGRFLEVMASALGYDLEGFWQAALAAESATSLSSMCTVFAETEVVTLVTSGVARESLALGLHQAIAERFGDLVARVGLVGDLLLVGGGAYNQCLRRLLEQRLGVAVTTVETPQIVSALGAALLGPLP